VVDPLLGQPPGELDDRHAARPGPPRHLDDVGDVVRVAVGEQDVGRLDLVRPGYRGRVIRLEERIDEDPRVALDDLEGGVSQPPDLHYSTPSISGSRPLRCGLKKSTVRAQAVSAGSGG